MSYEEIRQALNAEADRLGVDLGVRPLYRVMNSEELTHAAQSSYVELGAHTKKHSCLKFQSDEVVRDEVVYSKNDLEKIITLTGKKIRFFSYPFGGKDDFDIRAEKQVESVYDAAVINYPGIVYKDCNPYKIPRFLVRNWNGTQFHEYLREWFRHVE